MLCALYERSGRTFGLNALQEDAKLLLFSFDFDLQSLRGVQYPTGEPEFMRQAIHERPETDSLNRSMEGYAKSFDFSRKSGGDGRRKQ